ncbi:helix-turn-helix domain-containing protein [Thermomonas sp.]|uniref:helix-turn-helix domain-containing protein n=1 Tax=Thermomonas sp. TaxID=1971895 RepID=UPI00261EC1D8|nr:helix-turn-helix domain-containing protein [Thermomonas sp.]MCO5054648.1 helix-turn-helix domain-containing protein [Thermomonas sp.]
MNAKRYKYEGESDKQPYHYTECGLDDVYLIGGYEVEKTPYGEAVSVKNADELHEVIGFHLAIDRKVLAGKELRFLRNQMGLTQAELGRRLGQTSQSVARWEKQDICDSNTSAELLVRLLYLDHLGKMPKSITALLEKIEETDAADNGKHLFERKSGGWKPRLAA